MSKKEYAKRTRNKFLRGFEDTLSTLRRSIKPLAHASPRCWLCNLHIHLGTSRPGVAFPRSLFIWSANTQVPQRRGEKTYSCRVIFVCFQQHETWRSFRLFRQYLDPDSGHCHLQGIESVPVVMVLRRLRDRHKLAVGKQMSPVQSIPRRAPWARFILIVPKEASSVIKDRLI